MSSTIAVSGPGQPVDNIQVCTNGSITADFDTAMTRTLEDVEDDISSQRPSVLRNPLRKAKRVRFLRNGDRFFKGIIMPVTAERYRSFDSLLSELTRALEHSVTLPCGVRSLYAMDGRKIHTIDELEDGKEYLCSGPGECFKSIDYTGNGTLKKKGSVMSNSVGVDRPSSNTNTRSGIPDFVRPRILTLVRNGTRPRKIVRLLINRRNAPSMDHVLSCITEAVKLDTGAARKVFTQSGNQLTSFKEFFGSDDVFFIYGSERYALEDFELDDDEFKVIQSYRKGGACSRGQNNQGRVTAPASMPKRPGKAKVSNSLELPADAAGTDVPVAVQLKYQVCEVIGDGNFAKVFRCIKRATNREYALKVIDKSKCKGKEHMIESEVEIHRRVQHPNIIRLIAEHDEPEKLYLIMELVKGGDLFDAIAAAIKFNEKDASVMLRNLASALCYLHSLSIVHRDIKPENLLVEVDSRGSLNLKLGDFGLAQKVTEPLYAVCGTPTYVAPEILSETGYGLKIDVWAAGVILYILLCGFPPFASANNDQEELFTCILNARFTFSSPYWDEVSETAKDLVTHMLQPVPELRLTAEDVLDHPWLAEAGGVEMLRVKSGGSLQYCDNVPDVGMSNVVSR